MEGFAPGGTSSTHIPSTWGGRMGQSKLMPRNQGQSQSHAHSQDLGSLCRPQSLGPEGQSLAPRHIIPALQRARGGRDIDRTEAIGFFSQLIRYHSFCDDTTPASQLTSGIPELSWAPGHLPQWTTPRRWRQENREFKVSLGYISSPRLA